MRKNPFVRLFSRIKLVISAGKRTSGVQIFYASVKIFYIPGSGREMQPPVVHPSIRFGIGLAGVAGKERTVENPHETNGFDRPGVYFMDTRFTDIRRLRGRTVRRSRSLSASRSFRGGGERALLSVRPGYGVRVRPRF